MTNHCRLIIAGPNGAGKTTIATAFLPHAGECFNFINANLIAAELAPFDPETVAVQTGRLMLAEMRCDVSLGESFAFETTLSGGSYARQIAASQPAGDSVDLMFLRLRWLKLALARVKARVAQGGHHIPPT